MRRSLLILLIVFSLSGCATHNEIKVVYSGLNFYIPGGPEAIGSAGGKDNFLGFKYSKEPGQRFIAFLVERDIELGQCGYPAFFEEVLSQSDPKNCNQQAVESFRIVFDVDQGGVWPGESYNAYYFPGDERKLFVFLVLDEQTAIKIDSNFLDKKQMRAVLADQLGEMD